MSREAMQQGIEALEKVIEAFGPGLTLQQRAITTLRQALETEKQWVGLTDEDEIPWDGVDAKSFARAIEAKLKEKNT